MRGSFVLVLEDPSAFNAQGLDPRQTLRQVPGDLTEVQTLEPPKHVPAYDVPESQVAGRWADGSISAAWRKTDAATWWSFGVCPREPAVLRALGCRAGCHVLNDQDDATTLGDGLLMVHTVTGGARTLRLPNGKTLSVNLPARSTTVFDAVTGATLLG